MDINELKEEAQKSWFAYGESIKKAFGFSGDIVAEQLLQVIETDDEDTIKAFIQETIELTNRMEKMRKRFWP